MGYQDTQIVEDDVGVDRKIFFIYIGCSKYLTDEKN